MIDIIALQQELQINGWRYDGADTAENALQSAISLSSPLIPQQGGEQTELTVRHAFENIRNNYVGWQGNPNFEVLSAALFSDGMPVTQEPKYGIRDNRLFNRASGEFIPVEEPVFIFRARDVFAARRIHEYSLCCDGDHRIAVQQRADDFSKFGAAYPERMKTPDTVLSSAAVLPKVAATWKPMPLILTPEMLEASDAGKATTKRIYDALLNAAPNILRSDILPQVGAPRLSDVQIDNIRNTVMIQLATENNGVIGGPDMADMQFPKRFAEAIMTALGSPVPGCGVCGDTGKWLAGYTGLFGGSVPVYEPCKCAAAPAGLGEAKAVAPESKLSVWYGSMPETNGKSNYTAILHKGDICEGITIDRSEYPERVRYEADRMRFMIGEIDVEPFILNYDADAHSGYAAPVAEALPVAAETLPETTREMALNVILWFYRRAKPKYGQLKFADDAIALLRTADGLQGEKT